MCWWHKRSWKSNRSGSAWPKNRVSKEKRTQKSEVGMGQWRPSGTGDCREGKRTEEYGLGSGRCGRHDGKSKDKLKKNINRYQ